MNKSFVYIYGAGNIGRTILSNVKDLYDVKGFVDSDSKKWGTVVDGVPILGGPEILSSLVYEKIIIAITAEKDILREMLISVGVPENKIDTAQVDVYVQSRINFLKDFASSNAAIASEYSVAEGGVFQGNFAKVINSSFPNSKLFLFDTFEGFTTGDTDTDCLKGFSDSVPGRFSNTSEETVLKKLDYPEKAIIKRGYFPETTRGIEGEEFFFVNLDFDLYNPTLEGLRFFYPRLVNRGVILIHDYFTQTFHGVAQAIEDFEKEIGYELVKLPIGDHCSIAIIKIC